MSLRAVRSFCFMSKNCLDLPKTMGQMPEFLNRAYCWTTETFLALLLLSIRP